MPMTIGDRTATLRSTAAPLHLPTVAGHARVLRRGEPLYLVGSASDTVYRVESGLLAMSLPLRSGRERIVALAGPGEFLGALAPERREHEERAEALSATVVVIGLPRAELDDAFERTLFETLDRHASRLRYALEDADRPVVVRLGLALIDLGWRYGHLGEDGATRLTLPLTHEHLAAMIGAARETTSAALATLRAEAGVDGTRGRYRFVERTLRDALTSLDPKN
ncbi:MAG: Crp/Fnr family transcriptional regulator [Trueperaceae bacterium]|nr:Crp/Fnr family transcriptional regulator [Trueperaceae bacterium]